jgi:hypothetical protein
VWSLEALLIVLGVLVVPFGIWLLTREKLPPWMKGFWTWPLGNNLTAAVIHMQGWAALLIGASSFAASTLHLFPYHSAEAWSALSVTVLLVTGGVALYVRSLLLSRHQPG